MSEDTSAKAIEKPSASPFAGVAARPAASTKPVVKGSEVKVYKADGTVKVTAVKSK